MIDAVFYFRRGWYCINSFPHPQGAKRISGAAKWRQKTIPTTHQYFIMVLQNYQLNSAKHKKQIEPQIRSARRELILSLGSDTPAVPESFGVWFTAGPDLQHLLHRLQVAALTHQGVDSTFCFFCFQPLPCQIFRRDLCWWAVHFALCNALTEGWTDGDANRSWVTQPFCLLQPIASNKMCTDR